VFDCVLSGVRLIYYHKDNSEHIQDDAAASQMSFLFKKMENQVLKMGKLCLQSLTSVIELVSAGKHEEASERLLLLKDDGILFSEKVKELLSYQKKIKTFYVKAEVNSKRDISECTHKLLELMEKQASMLSYLERNTILSFYFQSKLSMSEEEFKIVSQAAKILCGEGRFCSKFSRGLSPNPGDCDVKDEVFKKEMILRSVVEHNKHQSQAASVVLDTIRKKLRDNKAMINCFAEKLGELQTRRNSCHRNLIKKKQNVEFLENTWQFWLLLHQVSDKPAMNVDMVKLITSKAREKTVPSGRASRTLGLSFLEAMESEMVQAEKGYSQVFSFTFHCGSCNLIREATPVVNGHMVVCSDCL